MKNFIGPLSLLVSFTFTKFIDVWSESLTIYKYGLTTGKRPKAFVPGQAAFIPSFLTHRLRVFCSYKAVHLERIPFRYKPSSQLLDLL